jgi:hypothetical protein
VEPLTVDRKAAYDKRETGRSGLQDDEPERLPVRGEEKEIAPAVGCANIVDESCEADVRWTVFKKVLEARAVEEKSVDSRPNPDERDVWEKASDG